MALTVGHHKAAIQGRQVERLTEFQGVALALRLLEEGEWVQWDTLLHCAVACVIFINTIKFPSPALQAFPWQGNTPPINTAMQDAYNELSSHKHQHSSRNGGLGIRRRDAMLTVLEWQGGQLLDDLQENMQGGWVGKYHYEPSRRSTLPPRGRRPASTRRVHLSRRHWYLLRALELLSLEGEEGLILVQAQQVGPVGIKGGIIVICEGLFEE